MTLDTLSVLQAVFESTADGILIVDLTGKVVQSNRRFQEMWSIPDSLMERKDDEALLGFITNQLVDPGQFFAKVRELYQKQGAISKDLIWFKDGRCFARHSRPLMDGEKNIGRVWNFRDITEQKKAEEVFRAIAELSPDIISILGPDGILKYNSPAAERIHGYPIEFFIGMNTFDLIHPDDQAACSEGINELMRNPSAIVTVQYRYRNSNGAYAWMEATASNQISNPHIQGLVAISREIGKRKLLEEELSDALRSRDEFISIITHELKTPVTSMKLQLQMLLRSGKSFNLDEQRHRSENLPAMIGQVNSLERLIDDLLQISRIRNGKFECELKDEDLSQIIRECWDRTHGLLQNVGCPLTVKIEEGIRAACDRQRIEQVLSNLISNAARYAPGKPVTLTVCRNGDFAEFRLKDEGPGIPDELQKEIFRLFCRGPSAGRDGGFGIGLFITSSIIEQHNGTISVNSLPGQGSEFIVRLPAL